MVRLVYINLTPGLENSFIKLSHHPIINVLRTHEREWAGFYQKYPDYSLGLTVVTEKGVNALEVKGPTVSRKLKNIDYSIFLPENIQNMNDYLENIFNGVNTVLEQNNVTRTEGFKKDIESIYSTLVV
jgi:hypothetical protein